MSKLQKTIMVFLVSSIAVCVGSYADNGMNRFNDVPESAWYGDVVEWAVEEGVADGTGNGTFSPDDVCTRAQIITFIWRMAGAPEPFEKYAEIFYDLAPDAYYYHAMLWANEEGLVSGTSANTLSPDEYCTRAQAVTMLWRYCGSDDSYTTYFIDVPESAYYYKAVAWASNRYVADGMTLLEFSPDGTCTRAQIVTMLYRMQRTGTEALRSGDIQSVLIENLAAGSNLKLTAGKIDEFKAIISRAALNDNPEPQLGQGQTSNPMYVVHIVYAEGGEDIFYSPEAGAEVLYKFTGTYGPGGEGYVAIRSREIQEFFDSAGI